MRKKGNADKIAERRAKRKQNLSQKQKGSFKANNRSIYSNENLNYNRDTKAKKEKIKKRKRRIKKKSFKNYIIVLFVALLILIVSVLSGNRKEDVSKFFYLNNEKIKTKSPIKVSLAKNSTAKVAVLSLEDIKENFDENIRYDNKNKEIITIGKTHIAKIILNDYGININGTESVINVSAFEDEGKIYLPLNDLSSVYGIEVFVTNTNRVIVDEVHKEKKLVKVFANTKLKKSKNLFSKTLLKLSEYEDYVLVEEGKKKLKIRTLDGFYGYIPAKKSKSIIEIRSDYIEDEKKDYNFIRNYKNPDDNFDDVKLELQDNIAIINLFEINYKSKSITLKEKYSKDDSAYKIFREKLQSNNIETIAELNLEKQKLDKYLESFDKREKFIYELLKISNNHNIQGIELLVNENSKAEIYENFAEELKPRLKERGLKLFIPEDKIKNKKVKGIIEYESKR